MGGLAEAAVERRLAELAAKAGGMALKLCAASRAGVPDRLVLLPGGVARFVELKARGGKTRPIQDAVMGKIRRMGHHVSVLRSAEEVEAFMDEACGKRGGGGAL
jgi:hypothetical protein